MLSATGLQTAVVTCQKSSTAATVSGSVILLAIVAGIVVLAVANGRARGRLTAAKAELAYLRPENARLQDWVAHLTGAPSSAPYPSAYPSVGSPAAGWHPDPSERHELRFWDGTNWTEHVSDQGVTATDPAE